jgi:hypothetical protein
MQPQARPPINLYGRDKEPYIDRILAEPMLQLA